MKGLDAIIDSMDISLRKLWEIVKDREAWHAAVHGVTKNWTWLKRLNNSNNKGPYFPRMKPPKNFLKDSQRQFNQVTEPGEGLCWMLTSFLHLSLLLLG